MTRPLNVALCLLEGAVFVAFLAGLFFGPAVLCLAMTGSPCP